MQIRIADIIARSPDHKDKKDVRDIKIAYLEKGSIVISPLSKEIISGLVL